MGQNLGHTWDRHSRQNLLRIDPGQHRLKRHDAVPEEAHAATGPGASGLARGPSHPARQRRLAYQSCHDKKNGVDADVEHFKLTSKDMSIPKDKRLNFDIWFDKKNALILKVAYSRMGNWEYRVKKFE